MEISGNVLPISGAAYPISLFLPRATSAIFDRKVFVAALVEKFSAFISDHETIIYLENALV
jgi:hypothetical protein